ncbi:unnamed protein product [Trichogramma brassicae]|uniref:Uncharacterized protein n=1 Tax=Trichogramma brassicae TaxID=86971 RepID=A0A6H5HXZ1_9HYME|nr:unnamed protein product [Trichogramma brassicae]
MVARHLHRSTTGESCKPHSVPTPWNSRSKQLTRTTTMSDQKTGFVLGRKQCRRPRQRVPRSACGRWSFPGVLERTGGSSCAKSQGKPPEEPSYTGRSVCDTAGKILGKNSAVTALEGPQILGEALGASQTHQCKAFRRKGHRGQEMEPWHKGTYCTRVTLDVKGMLLIRPNVGANITAGHNAK